MKSHSLFTANVCIALLLLATSSFAQKLDSISAKALYGFAGDDLKILAELDHIDHYKLSFDKQTFSGNSFIVLTTKEYSRGKVVKQDTLISAEAAKEYFSFKKLDSTTKFTLTTKPQGDSVKFLFRILNAQFTKTYKRLNDDAYSLRDGLVTNEEFKRIPLNKTLPLFAYSLPYDDPKQPNARFYCAITANGVQPDKWWETYKIPHYIIVEMKIVSEPQ